MGLESMQKCSSSPSIWLAMRLRICSQRLLHRLAAVVELTAGDKVGNRGTTLLQLRLKQPVLAFYLLCLGGHAQGDDFRIRKTRHNAYFQDKKILRICQIQKLCLSLHPNSEHHDLNSHIGVAKFTFASLTLGEMVEWSITAVLKTAVPRGTGGSNPSLSAKWLQDDFKMVVKKAFKTSVNRCKTYTYNDFSLYISLYSDG